MTVGKMLLVLYTHMRTLLLLFDLKTHSSRAESRHGSAYGAGYTAASEPQSEAIT